MCVSWELFTLASYTHTYISTLVNCHNILLGVQQSVQLPISTAVTTNTQTLSSSDQQHHFVSHSKSD